jgi:hypothetical protein
MLHSLYGQSILFIWAQVDKNLFVLVPGWQSLIICLSGQFSFYGQSDIIKLWSVAK